MLDLLACVLLIAAAALLGWLSVRAWKTRNRILKWGGAGLAALLSAAVTLASVIMMVGLFKAHARSAPTLDLRVATSPEQIQRGRAIADGFCSGCHSKTGTLTGGLNVGELLPMRIGSFVSSNLLRRATRGLVGRRYFSSRTQQRRPRRALAGHHVLHQCRQTEQ